MMASLMENPDVIRSMMMSNPQVRAVIESNPELGHMLSDPSLMFPLCQRFSLQSLLGNDRGLDYLPHGLATRLLLPLAPGLAAASLF